MLCALCLLRAEEPRVAITTLHGTAMCDVDFRTVNRRIAHALQFGDSPTRTITDSITAAANGQPLDPDDLEAVRGR